MIQMTEDFLSETIQIRTEYNNISNVMKEGKKKNCQSRILYRVKIFYRNKKFLKII